MRPGALPVHTIDVDGDGRFGVAITQLVNLFKSINILRDDDKIEYPYCNHICALVSFAGEDVNSMNCRARTPSASQAVRSSCAVAGDNARAAWLQQRDGDIDGGAPGRIVTQGGHKLQNSSAGKGARRGPAHRNHGGAFPLAREGSLRRQGAAAGIGRNGQFA